MSTAPVSITDLLVTATADVEPRVVIPDGVTAYLNNERSVFATQTNRFKRSVTFTDALSTAILANRPRDLKLAGIARDEAAAKEFCRQVKQYADDHKLSTRPERVGSTVTYRLAKSQAKKS
jgi:hypothetical protein